MCWVPLVVCLLVGSYKALIIVHYCQYETFEMSINERKRKLEQIEADLAKKRKEIEEEEAALSTDGSPLGSFTSLGTIHPNQIHNYPHLGSVPLMMDAEDPVLSMQQAEETAQQDIEVRLQGVGNNAREAFFQQIGAVKGQSDIYVGIPLDTQWAVGNPLTKVETGNDPHQPAQMQTPLAMQTGIMDLQVSAISAPQSNQGPLYPMTECQKITVTQVQAPQFVVKGYPESYSVYNVPPPPNQPDLAAPQDTVKAYIQQLRRDYTRDEHETAFARIHNSVTLLSQLPITDSITNYSEKYLDPGNASGIGGEMNVEREGDANKFQERIRIGFDNPETYQREIFSADEEWKVTLDYEGCVSGRLGQANNYVDQPWKAPHYKFNDNFFESAINVTGGPNNTASTRFNYAEAADCDPSWGETTQFQIMATVPWPHNVMGANADDQPAPSDNRYNNFMGSQVDERLSWTPSRSSYTVTQTRNTDVPTGTKITQDLTEGGTTYGMLSDTNMFYIVSRLDRNSSLKPLETPALPFPDDYNPTVSGYPADVKQWDNYLYEVRPVQSQILFVEGIFTLWWLNNDNWYQLWRYYPSVGITFANPVYEQEVSYGYEQDVTQQRSSQVHQKVLDVRKSKGRSIHRTFRTDDKRHGFMCNMLELSKNWGQKTYAEKKQKIRELQGGTPQKMLSLIDTSISFV